MTRQQKFRAFGAGLLSAWTGAAMIYQHWCIAALCFAAAFWLFGGPDMRTVEP